MPYLVLSIFLLYIVHKGLVRYSATLTIDDEVKDFIVFTIPIEDSYALKSNNAILK